MIEYPKIDTLYDRDEKTRRVLIDHIRHREFLAVKTWDITEKIDGTNIRIGLNADGAVKISGRTDAAQIYGPLAEFLYQNFPAAKMQEVFWAGQEDKPEIVLFGEGYGEKIQKGGNYRKGISFRLFDIWISGWWLEMENVWGIAQRLNIPCVPWIRVGDSLPESIEDLESLIPFSLVSQNELGKDDIQAEGIVAHSHPLMLFRNGQRIIWKLKFKDFETKQ